MNKKEKILAISEKTGKLPLSISQALDFEDEVCCGSFASFEEAQSLFDKKKESFIEISLALSLIGLAEEREHFKYLICYLPFGQLRDSVLIKFAKTIIETEEFKDLYEETASGSLTQRDVYKIWESVSSVEVSSASNTLEAKKAWISAPDDSLSKSKAWSKWFSFSLRDIREAKTQSEARSVYELCPPEPGIRNKALISWDKISLLLVPSIDDFDQANKIYFASPPEGLARTKIAEKWIVLFRTGKELKALCMLLPFGSVQERLAFLMYEKALILVLESANNEDDVISVLHQSFSGSRSEKRAIQILYEKY